MSTSVVCMLLLTACFVSCLARSHPPALTEVEGLVNKEADVVDQDGGRVHLKKKTDSNCLYEQDTATFPDKSVSAVVKDFASGKSALMFSNAPDICFIRDIPQKEQFWRARGCKNGVVSGSLPAVWRNYVEGGELSSDDLSQLLADVCDGRKIVALVEASSPQADKPARSLTERAGCETRTCRPVTFNCKDVCVKSGWWFRENECWDRERRCDTGEECKTVNRC